MDHPARCGMTARSYFAASAALKQHASCSISGGATVGFDGRNGKPNTFQGTCALSGLDSSQPFPNAGAIAYATDLVGTCMARGAAVGDDLTGALSAVYEFGVGDGLTLAQARKAAFLAE